jgi:hypothetical protein
MATEAMDSQTMTRNNTPQASAWRDNLTRAGLALSVLVPLMALPLPFFWDSITLGSEVARHFYDQGLDAWLLPPALDSGHPPFFGWYLALWWKALGPSLPVAHLAMLPVLVLLWWQFDQLCRWLFGGSAQNLARLLAAGLLLFEPTFAAQIIHVGPDPLMLALYLGALNAMRRNRWAWLSFFLTALCAVSLRGCVAVASLWVCGLLLQRLSRAAAGRNTGAPCPAGQDGEGWTADFAGRSAWAFHLPFALATGLFLLYIGLRAGHTGWYLVNPDSSWSAAQGFAGWSGMLRNAGLIAWRILDFGRLVLWLPGLALMWTQRHRLAADQRQAAMLILFVAPLLVHGLFFLPFSNPIAHRYLLVVLVLALPWFAWRLVLLDGNRRRLALIMLVAMLGFGHRWIYPDKTAQGWDASLAHLPYFSLLDQAWKDIPEPGRVATEFPLYKPLQAIRPGSVQQRESFRKAEGDWLGSEFILYSNIINDIPDATYDVVTQTWPLEREWTQGKVFLRLYRRPGHPPMELPERELP